MTRRGPSWRSALWKALLWKAPLRKAALWSAPLGRALLVAVVLGVSGGALGGCSTLRATAPVTALPQDEARSYALILRQYVDDQGRVDFQGLAANRHPLEIVVAGIGRTAPNNAPSAFPARQDQLVFHINAYNALSMYDVIRSGIPSRLSLLDRIEFFKLTRVVIGGQPISLYDYENDVIRPLGEERVHFALNCMAVSCPRLPRVPFTAAGLDQELDGAARLFLSEPRNVQIDPARRVVRLSAILRFYTEDFLKKAPSLIAYVNRYRTPPIPEDYTVEFIDYDWTINAQPKRPAA